MNTPKRLLLYIEPTNEPSEVPIVDDVTRKMTAAFRVARQSDSVWCGIHHCICGAHSTCVDYYLPDGTQTNSLCIHYVAYHREELPADEFAYVSNLSHGEAEPEHHELGNPRRVNVFRTDIQSYLTNPRVVKPADLELWKSWGLRVDNFDSLPDGYEERRIRERLLCAILYVSDGVLSNFAASVEVHHGSVKSWGKESLAFPGWSPALWVQPITDVLALPKLGSESRWGLAHLLSQLRPESHIVIPRLLEHLHTANEEMSNDIIPALALLSEKELDEDNRAALLRFAQTSGVSPLGRIAAVRPFRQSHPHIFARVQLDVFLFEPSYVQLPTLWFEPGSEQVNPNTRFQSPAGWLRNWWKTVEALDCALEYATSLLSRPESAEIARKFIAYVDMHRADAFRRN